MKWYIVVIGTIFLISVLSSYSGSIQNSDVPYYPVEEYSLSDGESWLAGWRYRQQLEIHEVFGAPAGYAMKAEVYYNVGTDDDGVINCTNKAQTDFDDIRFTDNDGSTVLSYWRETYTASTSATFWVKVNDAVSSGTVVIYIYYGNSGASYIGDGDDVFLFFDDFEDNNLNKWDVAQNAWATQGTVKKYGSYAVKGNAQTTNRQLSANLTSSMTSGVLFHSWVYFESAAGTEYPLIAYEDDDDGASLCYVGFTPANDWATYDGSNRYYEENTQGTSTWYRFEVAVDFANTLLRPWINSVAKSTQTLKDSAGGSIVSIFQVAAFVASSTSAYDQWQDDFYIRHYYYSAVYGEPEIGTPSAEEDLKPVNVNGYCGNPDDTDFIYARKSYNFIVNTTVSSDYTDFDKVYLIFKDADTPANTLWQVYYDEDSNTFTESTESGHDVRIELNTSSSSYTKSGTHLDVVFVLKLEWVHPEELDCDITVQSQLSWGGPASDTDIYNTDYNTETRLDFSSFSLSDGVGTLDRGNYDTEDGITASGTVIYYGGTVSPASNEVDVWVSCPDIDSWSDLTLSSGAFSMTVDSDNVVGLDTYTFKAVIEGAGSSGTDQCHTTHTDTYIADYAIFSATVSDTYVQVGASVTVTVYAQYAYLSQPVTGSLVWLNSQANGTAIENTAVRRYYGISSFSDTHGITEYTNTTTYCTWDDIVFTSGPTYYWVQYSVNKVWLIWGVASQYVWDYNNSALPNNILLQSVVNGTDNAYALTYGSTIGGLAIGPFDTTWYYANITIVAEFGGSYEWNIWSTVLTVDILHTIYIENFMIQPDSNRFWVAFQSNWNNASITIWDTLLDSGTASTDAIYYSGNEGFHEFDRSTVVGVHFMTVLINGSATAQGEQYKNYIDSDSWWWYNFTYTVPQGVLSVQSFICDGAVGNLEGHTGAVASTTVYWATVLSATAVESGSVTSDTLGEFSITLTSSLYSENTYTLRLWSSTTTTNTTIDFRVIALDFTSAQLVFISFYNARLEVTGATYSDTLYDVYVSLSGQNSYKLIADDVSANTIIQLDVSDLGQRDYKVYAVARSDAGNYIESDVFQSSYSPKQEQPGIPDTGGGGSDWRTSSLTWTNLLLLVLVIFGLLYVASQNSSLKKSLRGLDVPNVR